MAVDPSAIEQTISRTLRDNLDRIQRSSDELHQAISDLVSACASTRPSNTLPPMIRAQTSASSLAAMLEVLSRFVTATMQPALRSPFEQEISRAASLVTAELATPVVQPEAAPTHQIDGEPHSAPARIEETAATAEIPPAVETPPAAEMPRAIEIPSAAETYSAAEIPLAAEMPLATEIPPAAEMPSAVELSPAVEMPPAAEVPPSAGIPPAAEVLSSAEPILLSEPVPVFVHELSPEAKPVTADQAQPQSEPVEAEQVFNLDSLPPEEQELHRRAYRVAKVSMQDIKLLRPGDVQLGRENKDLCFRLRDDIEKAHKEYDRRFQSISSYPVDYFYHWMVEILAGGDPEALGEYPYPSPVLRR